MSEPKKAERPYARGQGRGAQKRSELQAQAFYLSVEGKTYDEIAATLGINRETVCHYVRAEEEARAAELAERRETEKARRIARLQYLSKIAEDSRTVPGSGALGACGKFEEMINRILGVDAPTKIDIGLRDLLQAFDDPTADNSTNPGLQ